VGSNAGNARFVRVMRGQVSLAFMGAPPAIEYASLGMADSIILMIMALVVFGPRRLPQIGRQIGKLMYEFRKASNDFKFQMEEELRNAEEADRRKKEEEQQRTVAAQRATEQASVSADPPAPVVMAVEPPSVTAVEESVPRILPPATGEIVAADRPVRTVEPSADSTGDSADLGASANGNAEAGTPETGPQKDTAAEALNQHG
jgi:sec-independent protein translocase protein TatB